MASGFEENNNLPDLTLSTNSSHADSICSSNHSNHCAHHGNELSSCEHCLDNVSLHSIRSSSYDEGVFMGKNETDPDCCSLDDESQIQSSSSVEIQKQLGRPFAKSLDLELKEAEALLNDIIDPEAESCNTIEKPLDPDASNDSSSPADINESTVVSDPENCFRTKPTVADNNMDCENDGSRDDNSSQDTRKSINIKTADKAPHLGNHVNSSNTDTHEQHPGHMYDSNGHTTESTRHKTEDRRPAANIKGQLVHSPGPSRKVHGHPHEVYFTPDVNSLLTLSLPLPAKVVCTGNKVKITYQPVAVPIGAQPLHAVDVAHTSSSQNGLRKTFSEPDLTQQQYLHSTAHTWYRRAAYSQCGSIAGSVLHISSRRTSNTPVSLWSATKQEKALLVCILMANLCAMMCLSVMAPFYPTEAEKKGVNLTLSGWIFGVFALTEFVFAPIWGKMVSVIDPKFMFLAGMFFAGGCYILFGFVQHIPSSHEDQTMYLTFCFLLRIFTAIGCSAAATSTYTITALTFPNNIATVFGLIETSTGVGMSLGPTIGGVLFDAGGFILPFVFLGGLMIAMVPVSKCMLPTAFSAAVVNEKQSTSVTRLLRVPAIQLTCMCVLLAAVVLSVPEPTLEPHLLLVDQYHLSSTLIGLIFLLMSGSYGILAPFYGLICDRLHNTTPLMAIGFLMSGFALMLLGPSPHFGFPEGYNKLWLNLIALTILGAALSLATVPTFDKILRAAGKAGFEDNVELYGVVAGMWGSCNAFGDFIGLSVSGFLTEQYTFPWSMTFIAYACWILTMFCIALWVYESQVGDTQVITCDCCGHNSLKHNPAIMARYSTENSSYQTYTQSDDGLIRTKYIPNKKYLGEEETQPLLGSSTSVHYNAA